MITKEELISFEEEVAQLYEQGKIKSPIHLHGGNENELIEIFKYYQEGTWIFSTHRSHYHWLLSGKSIDELRKQILDGHSMHIYGYKFFTSAIVSGVAPIALGVAQALKIQKSKEKVWCFIGDMAASGGLVKECIQYSEGWDLPIVYIVENNSMSVRAKTESTWGIEKGENKMIEYNYERKYPHAGSGNYVMF